MAVAVMLFLVLLLFGTVFRPREKEEPADPASIMNNYKSCSSCGGSGMKAKKKDIVTCPTCNGEGIVNK